MIKQSTYVQRETVNNDSQCAGNLWFRILLAVIAGAAVGAVAVPLLSLGAAGTDLSPEAYSHITKSSAFVAYVLLWLSMLAGLSITSKAGNEITRGAWLGMQSRFGLHRYMSLLGLGFAFLHALSLLGKGYMTYTLSQVLVPFTAGSYKTQWLGLGQVALYALTIVALSFFARERLGVRTWRLIHSLSFALFLMALIHGLQSGSDSAHWWASALYWVSAASVALGSAYRMLAVRAGRPKAAVAATGMVATGGQSQASGTRRVLQAGSMMAQSRVQASPVRVLARR